MSTTTNKPTERCIYCGADLITDAVEREGQWWLTHDWKAESELHDENCEWVQTRAFTLPELSPES